MFSLALITGCQCGRSRQASVDPPIVPAAPTSKRAPRAPELERLWTRAESLEADDLASLARHEGGAGLVEGADEAHKKVALLALAYTDDFVGLPWAAEVASSSDSGAGVLAAESFVAAVVSRARHREPEDALELKETCKRWLAVFKNPKTDTRVRKLAQRGLRMLVDTRCLRDEDISGG